MIKDTWARGVGFPSWFGGLPVSRVMVARLGVWFALGFGGWWVRGGEPGPSVAALDFYESKVRPILAEHCYQCHSAKSKGVKGGLRLDDPTAMRKGGDTGPAVVPGEVDASLLMTAVRYDDELLRMPPKQRLTADQVAILERWVKEGGVATVSRSTAKVAPGLDFEGASRHWAYQPIREPAIPRVNRVGWASGPIDRFVLEKLEKAGLQPAAQADRRVLIRRATFDLIGLPPTLDEVRRFEEDRAPDAYTRLIDRLLASPHYGERWGRHWMDVARYADTKDGVLMFDYARLRPYAYTYRDYVIHAMNGDLGFDRFVQDQLAADQLAPKDEPWRLAAMGFLTLGRMFDNNVHDQIDDKIDTVTRGLLGLTVACARCHDHKYDAIPTADYYSLYGVFASCEAPLELPLVDPSAARIKTDPFEKEAGPKRKALQDFLDGQYQLLREAALKRTPDYLIRAGTMAPDPLETAIFFLSLAPEDLRPQIVSRWRRYLARRSRADDPVFGPWHELMSLSDGAYAASGSAVVGRFNGRRKGTRPGELNPLVAGMLATASIHSRTDLARAYGELFVKVALEPPATTETSDGQARRQIQAVLLSHDSPAYFPKSQTRSYMSRGEKDGYGGKLGELDIMAAKATTAPARAMVLVDSEEITDPRIFVRGNPSVLGDRTPRQFPRAIAGPNRRPFQKGSGRAELAQAITAPDNPLTARVIVNRVWMQHFGEPMVSTPSDFGVRGAPPTHPELLDYLASRLIREGWSLKNLHRAIMLSSVYQQRSADRPECRTIDPENRLLWRFPRRRLELEAMRDALLAVSGRLDSRMGGRSVDAANDPENARRTVYGLVDRQSLPGFYRAFDFASPDQSAERRPRTTVPQQALYSMNSPFAIRQAVALAASPAVHGAKDDRARAKALYEAILGRAPTGEETEIAVRFLLDGRQRRTRSESSRASGLERLAQVLLMTNEFVFID